jgi:hypothetical protein
MSFMKIGSTGSGLECMEFVEILDQRSGRILAEAGGIDRGRDVRPPTISVSMPRFHSA